MKSQLDTARTQLESVVKELQDIQTKRMRAEGQYEAAMENLKKLGYESIPDATKDYKKQSSELESSVDSLLNEVESFVEEFNTTFAGVVNGK